MYIVHVKTIFLSSLDLVHLTRVKLKTGRNANKCTVHVPELGVRKVSSTFIDESWKMKEK